MGCVWPNELYLTKSRIWQNAMYFVKLVVFDQNGKWVVVGLEWLYFVKRDCIWSNVFYHDGLYLVKIGCFFASWVLLGQIGSNWTKCVVFGQIGCFLPKYVVFNPNGFYFDKIVCIWPNRLHFTKWFVFCKIGFT